MIAVVALAALVAMTRTAADSDNRTGGSMGPEVTPGSLAPATSSPYNPGAPASPSPSKSKGGQGGKGSGKGHQKKPGRSPAPSSSSAKGDSGSASGHGGKPPSDDREPGGDADCTARFQLVNEWPDGFKAAVTLTSRESLNDWRVTWTFRDSQRVTQMWDGEFTQHGSKVTATSADYNKRVKAGGSLSMGFLGSWSDGNRPPGSFTLNGRPCAD
ncbi:cellulose binding domain-containing protein [Streptomyces rapamycinicus]|uniref:cellulose binding domain-containing protein n=1 Tax=Streptomyces rapamycinicus TaxID=1226757 RepID=UPI0032D92371